MINSHHKDNKKGGSVWTVSSIYVHLDSIAAVSIECFTLFDEEKQFEVEVMNVVTSCKYTLSTENVEKTLPSLSDNCYINESYHHEINEIVSDCSYKTRWYNYLDKIRYYNQPYPDKNEKPVPRPEHYTYIYSVEWDENKFKSTIPKIFRRLNDGVLKINSEFTDLLNELDNYPEPLNPKNPTFYHLNALGIAMIEADKVINWM